MTKCAKCNNDFGPGEKCQYCGVDKIVGMAQYEGYIAPGEISIDIHENTLGYQKEQMESTASFCNNAGICYNCGEVIPSDSKFCPVCGQNLWRTCPECQKRYSSKYYICNSCGTNWLQYHEEKKQKITEIVARLKEICERKEESELIQLLEEEYRREIKLEEQRRKEKQYQEWLNTPEGKAELARQEEELIKEEASRIRNRLRSNQIVEPFLGLFVTILMLIIMMGLAIDNITIVYVCGLLALLVIVCLPFVDPLYRTHVTNCRIKKWKLKHPTHKSNKYL